MYDVAREGIRKQKQNQKQNLRCKIFKSIFAGMST